MNTTSAAGPEIQPTILGTREVRMPVGGRIRAGIMVLTHAASQHATAQKLYDEGVAQGLSFESIERRIIDALPTLKNPLVPKNVPWFSVRRDDFGMPEIADQILALYGEDRGEGRRLYRFRAVFPLDQWARLMPHRYECFSATGLKYWSAFADDGVTLQCMTFAPVPVHPETRRAVRLHHGRDRILRPDNQGRCDPKGCSEFQRGECKLRGQLYFFIPGILTMDVMTLSTSSIYGLEDVRSHLALIGAARGGRLSGFLDDETATFWIAKESRDLPSIDERGLPTRRRQWVPVLKADLDITRLYRRRRDVSETLVRAQNAVEALERGSAQQADGDPASINIPSGIVSDREPEGAVDANTDNSKVNAEDNLLTYALGTVESHSNHLGSSIDALRDQLKDVLTAQQLSFEAFDTYASKRWGSGWKNALGGLKQALREIEALRKNPDASQSLRPST